jgi:ABC-type transport system involved in cytochrome c biogenesis ATPase subunit
MRAYLGRYRYHAHYYTKRKLCSPSVVPISAGLSRRISIAREQCSLAHVQISHEIYTMLSHLDEHSFEILTRAFITFPAPHHLAERS